MADTEIDKFASPATGASNNALAIIQDSCAGPLAAQAHQGALSALHDTPFALTLFQAEPASPYLFADLRGWLERHRPAGAILLPPLSGDPALPALCRDLGCRPICIAPDAPEGEEYLCSNDRQAASDATNYLVALGHRLIGFIPGTDRCRASRERELGYIDALAEHELDRGADLVAPGDGSFASGQAAALLLLQVSPRPTAIFAASDAMAAGALHVAHAKSIAVPGELSIVGFGNSPAAEQLWPPLTSVRAPIAAMAFSAAIGLIDPQAAALQPVEFFADLVPRASSGPAPS